MHILKALKPWRLLAACLLGGLPALAALAADPMACKAQCEADRAECRVAAEDLGVSEANRRSFEKIGTGEIKLQVSDLATIPEKRLDALITIHELQGRRLDRLQGCERTYNNCTNLICFVPRISK